MKDYHNYNTIQLGGSDIGELIVRGFNKDEGLFLKSIHYGEDGSYKAYLVDAECEIPGHYELIAEADTWMQIYDDVERVFSERGHYKVYRAGEFGTIIQKLEATHENKNDPADTPVAFGRGKSADFGFEVYTADCTLNGVKYHAERAVKVRKSVYSNEMKELPEERARLWLVDDIKAKAEADGISPDRVVAAEA